MKRWMFGAVMAVLLAGAAFSIADAQAPATASRQGRAGHGPGWFGPPGMGGRGPLGFGLALGRIADLTEEQRAQIKAILDENRPSQEGPPAGADLHRQLRAELLADAPDDQKIESLRQQIIQAAGESLARHIEVQRKIAQVLTPEQRATAREHLAQGPPRGGRGRGGGLR